MPPMATYVIAAGGAEVLVSAQRFTDDSIEICAALGSELAPAAGDRYEGR